MKKNRSKRFDHRRESECRRAQFFQADLLPAPELAAYLKRRQCMNACECRSLDTGELLVMGEDTAGAPVRLFDRKGQPRLPHEVGRVELIRFEEAWNMGQFWRLGNGEIQVLFDGEKGLGKMTSDEWIAVFTAFELLGRSGYRVVARYEGRISEKHGPMMLPMN